MARTETIVRTLYTFDELSDSAKEKAHDWWRECEAHDFDPNCTYHDFENICEILGIELGTLKNGQHGFTSPAIYWTGFWSQGDGASFEGRYAYKPGAAKAIREYAPQDETLHDIADALQALQRPRFYRVGGDIRQGGYGGSYVHDGTMHFDAVDALSWEDFDAETSREFQELFRDLARWLYRQLEAEYEDRMSDESVDEAIRINEYEFLENGERA